jgi:polyketide synthase PksN
VTNRNRKVTDLVQYIFGEVKHRRLSKDDALDFIRQFQARAEAGGAPLHPLLQRNTSDLAEQRFSSMLHARAFFLTDHMVKGQRVLPGVCYLEMAREALVRASEPPAPGAGVRLRNVVWARPIVVQDAPVEAHIGLYPEADGAIDYEVYVRPDDAGDAPAIHSRGMAEWTAGATATVDLAALRASCTREYMTADAFYVLYRDKGLALGPGLRAVQELWMGEDVVLARLAQPAGTAHDGYVLHPSLMDAAVTASVGLRVSGGRVTGPLALPFALQELELLGSEGLSGETWAVARFSPGSRATDRVQKYDLDVCDANGQVRVRFRGFSTRILEQAAAEPETLLLQPEWRAAPVRDGEAPRAGGHHVLWVGDAADATALAQRLDAHCAGLPEGFAAQVETVLEQVRAGLDAHPAEPLLMQLVVPASGVQRVSAALAGVLRSARLEYPRFIGQLIEIDANDVDHLAAVLRDNARHPDDVQVRYAGGERQVLGRRELTVDAPRVPWKDGGVYLVTGGLGGLGYLMAREIAGRVSGATLVLTGRRRIESIDAADGVERLRALEALGATVDYRALDVTDRDAVAQAILRIQEDHQTLDGIVHAAGVLRDSLLANKTSAECAAVLGPKVAGLIHLDEASRALELDCFICFSSLAAVLGNAGQTDYAAANAFMDAYAAHHNQLAARGERRGRMVSVNWPLWRDGGMHVDAATERAMEQATGMIAMRTGSGVEALYRALGSGLDQVAVVEGRAARMREVLLGQAGNGGTAEEAAPAAVIAEAAVAPEASVASDNAPHAAANADSQALLDKVKRLLTQVAAKLLKLKATEINGDAELSSYGFDSLMLAEFVNRLNQDYRFGLAPTVFFEYSTLNKFARHLSDAHHAQLVAHFDLRGKSSAPAPTPAGPASLAAVPASPAAESTSRPAAGRRARLAALPSAVAAVAAVAGPVVDDPVVIVGMSGCFPMADDVDAFWRNLADSRTCIREVPADRWDWRDYWGDPVREVDKTNIKLGGFIDGVGHFDPLFFGISPKEAEMMDPQQRLLMLHVWNCIEDAGHAPASLAGSQTALFVGTASTGYSRLVFRAQMAIEGYMNTGAAPSVGPNRMSYFLDLHGPSEPVETACSSALVAIRRGVQAIQSGESEMAIVGGVNTIVNPDAHISFSKAGMLCEDGRCKTFSDQANGYVRGEGVGMLLLKRLSAAERDGDHIYAIVRGTAENHGGRANSLTAPNPNAQAELIKTAFREAGIDPRTVGYMEAHGTGTPLGDPVEVNGLKMAFRDLYAATGDTQVKEVHCGIGSVKTNIGHLEMAAGVAGVIKVLMQMRHRTLAPSLHCETVNPYIDLKGSPFEIVREAREWVAQRDAEGRELPRRAGVSSFGFGGVNSHVVLEEYQPTATRTSWVVDAEHPALVVLSARNVERLRDRVTQLRSAIEAGWVTAENLGDAAYTLQVGREAMDARLAMAVTSVEELAEKLDAVLADASGLDEVYRGEVRRHKQELSLFASDEDAARMVDAWLEKGKYDRLLELWVKGLNVDWLKMYGDVRPQRLRLPTYPFARDRYWVPEVGAKPMTGPTLAAEVLHPLVHRNTSNLAEQRFTSMLSGQEPWLTDHVVRGRKMLPGVAHLEMARAALGEALSMDGGVEVNGLHLRNVVFSRPIVVGDAGLEVQVGVRPDADGELAYTLHGVDAESGERVVYSQGVAVSERIAEARIDLAAVRAACSVGEVAAADFYAMFHDKGLALGPHLRAVQALYLGDGQVLAQLTMPDAAVQEQARYVLHPSMMDSTIQTSIGLLIAAGEINTQLGLPFALERLEILGPTPDRMWSYVRFSAGSQAGDRVQKLDFDLCDDTGRVCVRFVGLSVRTLDEREAVSEPQTVLLEPAWQAEAVVGDVIEMASHLVLVADDEVDVDALSAQLGVRCERLPDDYTAQAEQVLTRLQTLFDEKRNERVLLQVVVPGYGAGQVSSGLAGLLRSARLENTKFIGQLIEVAQGETVDVLAAQLRENARSVDDVRIRYTDEARHVLGWREVTADEQVMPWKDGGVYLITGGLGGLGQIFAKEIATRARGVTLVLTGRREWSELSDEANRSQVRELEALGATVVYHALDVSDRDAVRQLVLQIQEEHQALNGIVHGAGVIRDGLLTGKKPEVLREVLSAKVAGLVNLDEASRDVQLDGLICFSSISAVKGNVGQSDYAAANGFMDSYARYRNGLVKSGERHGRTLSVNWPLWREGGMKVDAATEASLERATGLVALRTASGIDALYRAWSTGLDQVVVLEGEPARVRRFLTNERVRTDARAPVREVAASQAALPSAPASLASSLAGPLTHITSLLAGVISAQAKLKPEAIKGDVELNQYGFDSIMLTDLGNRLNHEFQLDLPPTVFFEYPTLDELAQHLGNRYAEKFGAPPITAEVEPIARTVAAATAATSTTPASMPSFTRLATPVRPPAQPAASAGTTTDSPATPEPIAIISLAGRFPQADDLDTLWDNLRAGRDGVTEVPADRWDATRWYDPRPGQLGKSVSKWGGFIDGVDQFDALFFNISPREALTMDPQARLFLQTTWTLLERAGYTRDTVRQRHQGRVGVYVGATALPGQPADDGEQEIAGLSSASAIANRVSYCFNFEGPSVAVDTMCSSAMMALHLACNELQRGACELAVVGGVCLLLSPQKYVGMSQARLLGSRPGGRSFTESDGYQPAETVGAVLLKPLSRALADGDSILAVVKGSAVAHGGRSNGYAAPNPKLQARVMAESLQRAGVAPTDIGWIEAGATGIALGDALEVKALASVFYALPSTGRKIPVGTVKSNLGHAEHGSGIAQLAKVVQQMRHGELAPLLEVGEPNRQIRFDETPFVLQRDLAAWTPMMDANGVPQPRRALINSFAAGGTYVSVVVEEYVPQVEAARDVPKGPLLFVWSARTDERLRVLAERALHRLEREEDVDLTDLAYTLQIGREAMDRRLAVVASTRDALCASLRGWLEGTESADGTVCHGPDETASESLQVLFGGQAGESLAAAMVSERNLDGLALYWAQGGSVAWERLHGEGGNRRIEWETYPFAPTVYPIYYGEPVASEVPVRHVEPTPPTSRGVESGLEDVVAQAVAAALGIPLAELPRRKSLQTLGYNSIAAMELKYRLETALQGEIGLELIADSGRSVVDLAKQLGGVQRGSQDSGAAKEPVLPVWSPDPAARHEPFPLTDMQEAFLLGRQATNDGQGVGAHIYAEIDVAGVLDIARLNRAWNRLVARHDMLRAVMVDGMQHVLESVPEYRCKTTDLRVMDVGERQFKAALLRETMEHRVFAGNEWPLFDIRVAILDEGRYRIHFSIDELIVDGLSVDTLMRQWDRLYADPGQNLEPLALTFRDYVLAMKAYEGSTRYQRDMTYWLSRLTHLPGGPSLPRATTMQEGEAALKRTRLTYRLPADGWRALQAKASTLGVSPTALTLGVFAEVLRAWSETPSFALVLTYFNRPPLHPQVRELVGPAISSLLFVVDESKGEDFDATVRAHHGQLWNALEHSSVSGIQVLRQLRRKGGRAVPATLPVVFTSMLGSDVVSEPLTHLGELGYVVNQTPQVYLDHQLRDSEAGLDCSWDVAEGYFASGVAQAMFDAYTQALAALAAGHVDWKPVGIARLETRVATDTNTAPATAKLSAYLAEAEQEDPFAPFTLTDQQQAYAFGRDASVSDGGACQFYQALWIEGLDVARLERAMDSLIARHPALRTVIEADGSQRVQPQVVRSPIAVTDLRRSTPEQRNAALAATRHDLLDHGMRLGGWPYVNVSVSLTEGNRACVHTCFDLMLVDSSGISQLLAELIQLYEQLPLNPAPVLSFRAYQRAVEHYRHDAGHAASLAYWNKKFETLPAGPALPRQSSATNPDTHRRISGELNGWAALKQQASSRGVAPGLVLLSAYLEVLHAWNGGHPLSVVVPGWERLPVHADIEQVVGDFTTLSWARRDNESLTFAERVSQVSSEHADDLSQRPVSGLQVLRRLMMRDRSKRQGYPVVFTNQITRHTLPGTQFTLGEGQSRTPQVHLDNLSSEAGERLECHWDFADGIYAPAMIREMFDGYLRLLSLLSRDPEAWSRADFADLIRARPDVYLTALDPLEDVV